MSVAALARLVRQYDGYVADVEGAGVYAPRRSGCPSLREPYSGDRCRYRLLQGIVGLETPLEVISKTRRGRLFMDGPHLRFSLGLGVC